MTGVSRRSMMKLAGTAAASAAIGGYALPSAASAAPVDGIVTPSALKGPSTVDVNEQRYLGCHPADLRRPYAKYMQSSTRPLQQQALEAYWGNPIPAWKIPGLADLATDLNRHGYSSVENGYGMVADGLTVWVAALTRMPGVTAQMWDWWFAWHGVESARYRLWHPDAHAYSAVSHDTRGQRGLTYRQRYIGNTSYVDEFIGGQLEQLAITFLPPSSAGLRTSRDTTVVYARVGSSELPIELGYLAHQVRPIQGGAEMRSRFYLNVAGAREVDLTAAAGAHNRGDATALAQPLPFTVAYARGLLEHCAREMNHLASFLPHIYAEFKNDF